MTLKNPFESLRVDGGIDTVTRLYLLLLVFSDWVVSDQWYFKAPLRTLAIVGLVVPPLHKSRTLWNMVAGFMLLRTFENWWIQDNHVFLATWFSMAMALAIHRQRTEEILATQARLLIGLSFLFAVLWKGVLSEDFINGDYFYFTFLTDNRFWNLATLFADLDPSMIQHNVQAILSLRNMNAETEVVTLMGSDSIRLFAVLVTVWTLGIEGLLAVLFLLPPSLGVARYRHHALLVFAWTTYLAANVATFGWTLLTLGLAQTGPDERRLRVAYVLTCPLLLIYDYVPIVGALARWFG